MVTISGENLPHFLFDSSIKSFYNACLKLTMSRKYFYTQPLNIVVVKFFTLISLQAFRSSQNLPSFLLTFVMSTLLNIKRVRIICCTSMLIVSRECSLLSIAFKCRFCNKCFYQPGTGTRHEYAIHLPPNHCSFVGFSVVGSSLKTLVRMD